VFLVLSATQEVVGKVECGGTHANSNLARAGFRSLYLLYLENTGGIAKLMNT
jgi:hypothetical protein